MAHLFDDDKGKIDIADAIKVSEVQTEEITLADYSWNRQTINLANETLYSRGYRPVGIVGYRFITSTEVIDIQELYLTSNSLKVFLINNEDHSNTITFGATILWIKSA